MPRRPRIAGHIPVNTPSEKSVGRRRGGIGAGFLVIFLFALGVFLLPFAFPTEGAIVAGFTSTAAFSPNAPGGRAAAAVAVKMRDAGTVRVLVTRGSQLVTTLIPTRRVPKGWVTTAWNGTDQQGAPMPDGVYTLQLSATSGKKGYNASRRVTIDRVRPQAPDLVVASAGAGAQPNRSQCVISATPSTYSRIIFVAEHLPGGRIVNGPHFVNAGSSYTWDWNGRARHGAVIPPHLYHVTIETVAVNGFQFAASRTCWVGNLIGTLSPAAATPGEVVTVHLATPAGITVAPTTPVTLQLARRTGTPGQPGTPVGHAIGRPVTTTAAHARIRLPRGIPVANLWIEAHTARGTALIAAGTRS
jgi:hypothetical protein